MKRALLVRGARQIVTMRGPARARRGEEMAQIGLLSGGSILVEDGRITNIGPSNRVENLAGARDAEVIDAPGCIVTPGLVDCHTHLLFPGPRLSDYASRLDGASYEEIARAGGGILTTMRAVRGATVNALKAAAERSAALMVSHGTTWAEVKSGYGLETAAELKMLRAATRADTPLTLTPTFLGLHALPPEFTGDAEGFTAHVCNQTLAEVARLGVAKFADVYCDRNAFSVEQCGRFLERASLLGLGLKLHASQFSEIGAVQLAVEMRAVSADHLEAIERPQVESLAKSQTVAVLLPGSVLHLGLSRYAPARELIEAGAAVALATDFNPGSSPTPSMAMAMSLACSQMRMTPAEAWTAATVNSAAALNAADEAGMLEAGRWADFTIWNAPDYRAVPYYFGANTVAMTVKRGRVVFKQGEVR